MNRLISGIRFWRALSEDAEFEHQFAGGLPCVNQAFLSCPEANHLSRSPKLLQKRENNVCMYELIQQFTYGKDFFYAMGT
jgi:hypothetical protein